MVKVANTFITAFDRPSFTDEPHDIELKTTDKELSTSEQSILRLIQKNSLITQKEIALKLGLSEDGVRYNTNKLKVKGIIKRIGGKKEGRWQIC